jgi:hypothetical protein
VAQRLDGGALAELGVLPRYLLDDCLDRFPEGAAALPATCRFELVFGGATGADPGGGITL